MAVRGVRGATTVERDDAEEIREATEELLRQMAAQNDLASEEIASVLFTVTPDLRSEFPAVAARERLGWKLVPFLNFTEIGVPGSLERCIRVLIHVNTEVRQDQISHVYLRNARSLRPDLNKLAASPVDRKSQQQARSPGEEFLRGGAERAAQ